MRPIETGTWCPPNIIGTSGFLLSQHGVGWLRGTTGSIAEVCKTLHRQMKDEQCLRNLECAVATLQKNSVVRTNFFRQLLFAQLSAKVTLDGAAQGRHRYVIVPVFKGVHQREAQLLNDDERHTNKIYGGKLDQVNPLVRFQEHDGNQSGHAPDEYGRHGTYHGWKDGVLDPLAAPLDIGQKVDRGIYMCK